MTIKFPLHRRAPKTDVERFPFSKFEASQTVHERRSAPGDGFCQLGRKTAFAKRKAGIFCGGRLADPFLTSGAGPRYGDHLGAIFCA